MINIQKLIDYLDKNRPELGPYSYTVGVKFYKILDKAGSAHCFVAMDDFRTGHLGKVEKGDFLKPATFSKPAKHARGNYFNNPSWDSAFEEYGMRYMR